jgi:carboxyl-terminal processing protease
MRSTRTWILASLAAIGGLAILGAALSPEDDFLFKINKGIDVFGRVYKEIATTYVDPVDPEKFMQAGIEGMLGTLDPYTTFIAKEDGDEVELMTTGRYGGIGVTIGIREGGVRVIAVMDGYSAQRAGILPGDRITRVDTLDVGAWKVDQVRGLTRGEPGTEVRVAVEREGEKEPLEFVLIREEIQVKNVTFAGMREGGIGYIRLERFSRNAGEEVRQAIRDLRAQGELKGVVLDLRGNPGGLLEAAVEVTSKFAPRGSLVVSTRGRRSEGERKYTTAEEPMAGQIPLAVLTDRGSASASEIVAGSLQDLDRAVIIGTRTFGKGLVQTIVPLNYGAQLKVTTARYYTPSGRSIQEIDYLHKDGNGVFATVPDSLKRQYTTSRGRKVYEAGGITPDSVVQEIDPGPMIRDLFRKALFFKFANRYVAAHGTGPVTTSSPALMTEFRAFLEQEKFSYEEETEAKLKELRVAAGRLHYSAETIGELDRTSAAIAREKERGFDRYRDHIARELLVELAARGGGEQGRIAQSLSEDGQLAVAMSLLASPAHYAKLLGRVAR